MRSRVLLLGLGLLGCGNDSTPHDGVYTMARDVEGYSGETLELRNGRFRYWFYSDVVSGDEPGYPLTGRYTVTDNILKLDHPKIHAPDRTFDVILGTPVLWRKDGLDLWEREGRIHPYAVLLRIDAAGTDPPKAPRPSLGTIKPAQLQEREAKEYEERFNDQPSEVRVLLRARSLKGDSNLDAYREEIGKARVQPDPRLLSQLVTLMGGDSSVSIPAGNILEDLFEETWLIPQPPPFMARAQTRKKPLEDLIAALSSARNRKALEHSLIQFLRASGAGRIDLAVEGTGLRIVLEALPSGGARYASEGTPTEDVDWLQRMPKLIPACQKWMRAQLEK
jgi:hypothetical protein